MAESFNITSSILDWLLAQDTDNPSIRYFTLVNLLDRKLDDTEVVAAREVLMGTGPVPPILSHQHSQGYWEEPGPGYRPKYTSTVWSLIMLAQLGADPSHPQVRKACAYLFEHALSDDGFFSMTGTQSGVVHCLQGNLAAALIDLGCLDDPRLQKAMAWMARSATGEGFGSTEQRDQETHYIRSGISGPGFLCSANDHQPCAWGAVKVALALSKVPEAQRTPEMQRAVRACRDFLLSTDPALADYPHPYAPKPSTSWFKYGFPVFYVTDLLQNLESLLALGLQGDPRLANAIARVEQDRGPDGTWRMTYSYNGKTWVEIEQKNKPSKWVTYRALSVLKAYYA